MSELEQLRQEAETLRKKMRVRKTVFSLGGRHFSRLVVPLSLSPSLPLSLFFSLFTCLPSLRRAHTHLFVCDFLCLRFSLYTHCTCTYVSVLIGIRVLLGLVIFYAYLNSVSISFLRFSLLRSHSLSLPLILSFLLPLPCHRFISPRTLSR